MSEWNNKMLAETSGNTKWTITITIMWSDVIKWRHRPTPRAATWTSSCEKVRYGREYVTDICACVQLVTIGGRTSALVSPSWARVEVKRAFRAGGLISSLRFTTDFFTKRCNPECIRLSIRHYKRAIFKKFIQTKINVPTWKFNRHSL